MALARFIVAGIEPLMPEIKSIMIGETDSEFRLHALKFLPKFDASEYLPAIRGAHLEARTGRG
jgi:hypothetical protein